MKTPVLGLALVALLAGCGGGGGGGEPSPTTPISGLSNVRVDVVIPNGGRAADPTNILSGEIVKFRLTGTDPAGTRVFIELNGWRSTVPAASGSLASDGTFTAAAPSGPFTVSVTTGGETFTTNAQVQPVQAILEGRIRTVQGLAANRIGFRVLDNAGTTVATGTTAYDGTFRISTPTTGSRFNLNFDVADPNNNVYFRQYAFDGQDYSTIIAGCTATLPPLVLGQTTSLTDVVVYISASGSPPPPPDGCGVLE